MKEPFTLIRDDVPGIFFVQGERGIILNSNAMLVETNGETHEAFLFDCGPGHGAIRKLRKRFAIKHVYLSHWHEDHILDHDMLRDATFHCHPIDIPPLLDMDVFLNLYGFEGNPSRDIFKTFLDSMGIELFQHVQPMNETRIEIFNGQHLEVIHTPGHSAGHCSFYEPETKIAFLADIDLTGFGPWYGGRDSSLIDFITSIDTIASLDIDMAFTGHKGIFTGEQLGPALHDFKEKIDIRNSAILELLSETMPKKVADLVGNHVIYKNYDKFKEFFLLAEWIMIEYHLDYLESKQQVIRDQEGYLLA